MLNNFVKGLKVFLNKKIIFISLLFIITIFCFNYISNTIAESLVVGVNLQQYPSFLINYYGLDLLWLLLGVIALMFIGNYATYLISHLINNSKKDIFKDIKSCFIYTLIICLFFSCLTILIYFSIININLFTIVLLIVITILAIILSLITNFAILFLPVTKTIKESFKNSWGFIKKKFWLIIVMLILLGLINVTVSYFFDMFIKKISNENIKVILFILVNLILTIYTTAVLSSFIKKK